MSNTPTHGIGAAAPPRSANACVVHFEKALRLAACRTQQAAGAQRRGDARAACSDPRTDPTLAARPRVFDLVATGQRTFRMYLVVLSLCRPMRGSSGPGKMGIEINSVFEFGPDIRHREHPTLGLSAEPEKFQIFSF